MTTEIEQFLKENCNKLTNGQCHTGACLQRIGWDPSPEKRHLYHHATCPALELFKMAEELADCRKEMDRLASDF